MNYLHISDVHLDHCHPHVYDDFFVRIKEMTDPDTMLFITGDITSATKIWEHVDALAQASRGRMFYVLGNHDRWGGSFYDVDKILRPHAIKGNHAVFMDLVDHEIQENVCIVGDSGWYDGRNGEQGNPRFIMNDWFYIKEYKKSLLSERKLSEQLADERAELLEGKLRQAITNGHKNIVVLTHVPPYVESCRHMGRISDDYALPWFSSRIMSDTLDQIAGENPDVMFEVLCGHTHDRCVYRRHANVNVTVAGADYGRPRIDQWKPILW